ncbi:MAG TPA: hypothetical protein VMI75_05930 [Polyangiaceae bacterium]|nr:hypothetical protein [Polyangiaceae bacterium]
MVRIARAAVVCAALAVAPALAMAQGAGPAPASSGEGAPGAPADTGAAPAASSATVIPATGYGWSTAPAPKHHVRAVRASKAQGPDAVMPGFEMLADGSSQLYVELTKPVQYDTKPSRGAIVYVLKGAHVDKRNNFNPLVTVHFNTPVTSARLVPHGKDLWFVVDLRASVQPTVTMDAAKEGGAIMRIAFPSGSYLPLQKIAPAPAPTPPPAASGAPAPAPGPAPQQ